MRMEVPTRQETVLLDLRGLQGGSASRGIGAYVRGILGGLRSQPDAPAFEALLQAGWPDPPEVAGLPVRRVERSWGPRWEVYEDWLRLARDLRERPPALYHALHLTAPRGLPCPVVITVHDLIPWALGGPEMQGERIRYWPARRRLSRARALVAVSRRSADDAVRLAGVDPRRIEVIHHGVDPEMAPRPGAPAEVAARWGISGRYLVHAGALDRRKRPDHLLAVWRAARAAGFEVGLVLTGDPGPQAPAGLEGAHQLGQVTRTELAALYSAAICLVFPSAYEGFGLPVLEAMACGCPVVAYDNSCLPEIAEGAAVLVPDGDLASMAGAVIRLLREPAHWADLRRAGLRRAAAFSWSGAARHLISVYRRLMG